jgi:lipoate-protein ligase A
MSSQALNSEGVREGMIDILLNHTNLYEDLRDQGRKVAVQMMAERGRGLVLVGAARLDLALEHLLKAVMAPSIEPDDKLFTPDRSLGSDGAKISLAARLGLIEAAIEQALHAIRSVRNDFAHSAGEPSLAEPRHQKRLQRVYPEAE